MTFLSELWQFLRVRKKLWMLPIIISMLLLGALMIIQASSLAPFLYTFF